MWPVARGSRLGHFAGVLARTTPPPDPPEVPDAIYVSTTGSDTTGTGSEPAPYRSLTKAVAEVVAGQTIYLRGGTYDTPGTDCYYTSFGGASEERAGDLDLRGKASAANPVTIRSYPGELAVIDGSGHSYYPRTAGDGLDVEEPYLMRLIGEYVTLSHLTLKNGVGKGLVLVGNNCTVKNFHTHSHHSDGLYLQGEGNLIEEFDGHHNHAISVSGNTGDAIKMVDYGSQSEAFFGVGARTRNNTVRRARFWLNSDDGIDTWTAPGTLLEDCASFNNGYDGGNGMGYKFGQSGLRNAGNIARRCVSMRNKSDGFTTNGATGVTFEWCTSYQPAGDIGLDHRAATAAQDGSQGTNLGRNNISYDANFLASPSTANDLVAYQNNTWDLSISNPSFASVDPSSTDFLKLSVGSSAIGAATDSTDLGAIQYGSAFPVPLTPCSMAFSGATPSAYAGSDAYPEWAAGGEEPVAGAIYMSLSGSDTTGTGTVSNPYRSLAKVSTVVQPGDTVYIRGGYYDTVNTDSYLTDDRRIKFSGTSAAPITVRSYPGEWAVFDGINHSGWPRAFVSTDLSASEAYEPRLLMFVGEWVNWEYLEFRNSIGGGPRLFSLDCKYRYLVIQNNHAVGLDLQGSRNEISYCLFQDNYSVSNDGASANGMMFRYSDQLTDPDRFPGETETAENHVHHCVSVNNSDDGFSTNTASRGVVEYNVAYLNGYGATGDGISFKMGFDGAYNTDNIARFNLAWGGGNYGFNTNYSTGVLIHNNTVWDTDGGGYALWVTSTPGSGDNTAHNNLYLGSSVSIYRESGVTTHENNAAYPSDWYDRPPNFALGDPLVMSFDPASADFLRLGPTSPYLSNGKVITGGSTTIGAIPDGEDFAGGWDWRAVAAAYPSHGLRSRATMSPIAQGTRTPYPQGGGGTQTTSIYMSPTGSDTTGDGSITSPYRSLAKVGEEAEASSSLGRTTTVYIRGGYYDTLGVDVYLNPNTGYAPELKFSGTETAPITVRSYPGEWAVFDGWRHPMWPLGADATRDAYEPTLIYFTGSWVNWEYLEFRNSPGRAIRGFNLDCKYRYLVTQNCHSTSINFTGSRNEMAYCLMQDHYSVSNDGNSGNGMSLHWSEEMQDPSRFPAETAAKDNHVHHNVTRNCSDDGFNYRPNGTTFGNNIFEHNVAFEHGYGSTGNGEGFKMGLGSGVDTGTICRFNLAWDNRGPGFNNNDSGGVLFHNNTAWDVDNGAFKLNQPTDATEAYNNLSISPGGDGFHRIRTSGVTIHTHNAGYPSRWDPSGGEGNFDTSNVDPAIMSYVWTNADFLRLGPTSPYLSNGKLITGGSTTLGAIPNGETFAGGWDWQTLVAAYPSNGIKSRTTMTTMPQGTRTPYPGT